MKFWQHVISDWNSQLPNQGPAVTDYVEVSEPTTSEVIRTGFAIQGSNQ